jgi:hypothetical protein
MSLMEVFYLTVSLCIKYRILKGYIAIYDLVVVIEVMIENIWRGREGLMVWRGDSSN